MAELIANLGRGFVILLGDRFLQVTVEILSILALDLPRDARGHFAGVASSLVHGLEQRVEPFGKCLVAQRRSQDARSS